MEASDAARRALGLLDLTDLDDHCTAQAIDDLLQRSHGSWGHVAAVCVWPDFVAQCARGLASSPVRLATVVNFPSGRDRAHAVGVLTRQALADGADEIDVVLPFEAWMAGDVDRAAAVLDTVRAAVDAAAAKRPPAQAPSMKVILETGAIGDLAAVRAASELAIARGADFIKTSTGKIAVSATPEAVETMLGVIREAARPVGIKPSGGIRTTDDALRYLELADRIMGPEWATPATFRFGASRLRDALLAELGEAVASTPTSY
jgi:deoxyribose-phosphate aldolase